MKDNAFFCPACGTPSVETSNLAGGNASCKLCAWKGQREELVSVPVEHSFSSQEEMLLRFIKQTATAIASTCGVELGRILLQWGFLDESNMQEELQKYVKMMAIAASKSAIETREKLEVERSNRSKEKYDA